jgi:hypothetical protein
VRQLHAHAWVEVFLKRAPLQKNGIEMGANDFAGWLTLDSTADTMAVKQQEGEGLWAQAKSLADFVEMQWITYVVGLSREQQREFVYQPIADVYQEVKRRMQGEPVLEEKPPLYRRVYEVLLDWMGGEWFSWRGLLVSVSLLLVLSGVSWAGWYGARYLWRWARQYWITHQSKTGVRASTEIAFYRKLEKLLAQHGFRREPGETQREFAELTASKLASAADAQGVAPLPREVADAFYAVRFGGRTLDSQQNQAVEQALASLTTALERKPIVPVPKGQSSADFNPV